MTKLQWLEEQPAYRPSLTTRRQRDRTDEKTHRGRVLSRVTPTQKHNRKHPWTDVRRTRTKRRRGTPRRWTLHKILLVLWKTKVGKTDLENDVPIEESTRSQLMLDSNIPNWIRWSPILILEPVRTWNVWVAWRRKGGYGSNRTPKTISGWLITQLKIFLLITLIVQVRN